MKNISAVILAGGKGERINATNDRNKVVYKLKDRPIVSYAVNLFNKLKVGQIIVVVGFAQGSVRQALGKSVSYAVQQKPIGTADALKSGLAKTSPGTKDVISVYGDDSAFYTTQLIKALVDKHQNTDSDITFVTITKRDPTGLGRIVRDQSGVVQKIVEEKNASAKEKKIQEINSGLYCFKKSFIEKYIHQISKNSLTQEYYLTDIIEIALKHNKKVTTLKWKDNSIWHGINTQAEFEQAGQKLKSS